ncbi:MAG: MFS transporter [Proteobacteria bacterium]|nr:MFS transporter [Pseudomonadota bacterium]
MIDAPEAAAAPIEIISPPAATRWDVIAVVVLAGVIIALNFGKVPPAIPVLRESLDLGLVAAGWTASMISAVSALFGFGVGIAVDRVGARRAILAALFLAGVASIAGAAAPNVAALLGARATEGLGFIIAAIAGPRLIATAANPADEGAAVGVWGSNLAAGIAAAMLAAPWLLGTTGWRGLWFGTGLITLVFLAAAAILLRPARWAEPHGTRAPLGVDAVKQVLARSGLWLLGAGFAVYAACLHALTVWLPTFLAESLGYDAATAAFVAALVVLANVGGNLAGAALMFLRVPRWLLIVAAFVATAASAVGLFPDAITSGPVRLAFAFAYSACSGLAPAAILASVPRHAPSPSLIGSANGMTIQLANVGALLGPPLLAATVAQVGGWQSGYLPLVGLCAAGIVLGLRVRAIERRA